MPETKLRLETAHQNTTGFLGVFKSWWPGDKNKPKNADVNGFKVILKHPYVKRAIHIRTFNKAEDAARVQSPRSGALGTPRARACGQHVIP